MTSQTDQINPETKRTCDAIAAELQAVKLDFESQGVSRSVVMHTFLTWVLVDMLLSDGITYSVEMCRQVLLECGGELTALQKRH